MSALRSSTLMMQTKHLNGHIRKTWPAVCPATCSKVCGMRLPSNTWKHQSTALQLSGAYRTMLTFSKFPYIEFRSSGPLVRNTYAKRSTGTGKGKKWISSASASLGEQSRERERPKFQRLAWGLAKVAGASVLVLAAFVVALPSVLSTKAGLRSTLAIVNRFVPGEIAVKQVREIFSPHSSSLACPLKHRSWTVFYLL